MPGANLYSPTFIIGHIQIGSITEASCFNMGNNYPTGFQNNKKHNQGFGNVDGDHNRLSGIESLLHDPDGVDFLSASGEEGVPDWVKELVAANSEKEEG